VWDLGGTVEAGRTPAEELARGGMAEPSRLEVREGALDMLSVLTSATDAGLALMLPLIPLRADTDVERPRVSAFLESAERIRTGKGLSSATLEISRVVSHDTRTHVGQERSGRDTKVG
jgi:hypothetical protein